MSFDRERLLELLPAVYRLRDIALRRSENEPGPLESLVGILAEQAQVIEDSLAQLYDDQFIETCAEWVVPYIGELVGARGLRSTEGGSFSLRSFVANTIAYRRRKGTAAVLEQIARDVTGWDAAALEFFEHLVATQNLNHLRRHCLATTDIRRPVDLQWLDTPFESQMHLAEVRRIASRRGKYNIPNVGVFLWRVRAYPLTASEAHRVDSRRFTFDPRGREAQLYQPPTGSGDISALAQPANVPLPISRRSFAADVDAFYGANRSMRVLIETLPIPPPPIPPPPPVPIPVTDIVACNLPDKDATSWANTPLSTSTKVHIDPLLGRIAFGTAPAGVVLVDYHYGFTADMGGGEYERGHSFALQAPPIHVKAGLNAITTALATIGSAREAVIEIDDSRTYRETLTITLQPGQSLELRAATQKRPVLELNGNLEVDGADDSKLYLNGLLFSSGGVVVKDPAKLARLDIRHCTIGPGERIAVSAGAGHTALQVSIGDSIVGSIRVPDDAQSLAIRDSIVEMLPGTPAICGAVLTDAAPASTIERSTIFGDVHVKEMTLASEVLFTAQVTVDRTQTGCVRFSYMPPTPRVPRRYRCQPDLAIEEEIARLQAEGQALILRLPFHFFPLIDEVAVAARVAARLEPSFTSTRHGDPGYAQLSAACAVEIRTGAEDGSEMGAFRKLQQGRREANLRAALDEYLRFGLEAGIFYVS